MGYKTVESVMKHSGSKGSARLLLMVLATHADEDTLECFPGRDLLCQEAAMSERNVIRALKELESLGELTMSRGNGRGNQSHYKLSIDTLKGDKLSPFIQSERVTKPVVRKGDKTGKKAVKLSSIERIKGDKSNNKGCQIRQERVTELVVKGDKSGFAYKEEPSLTIMEPSWNQEPPVAVAPVGGLSSKDCYALFVELRTATGGYEVPYQNGAKDFVQLARLLKTCERTNWTLTAERFTQAARNYFVTPRSSHTLADLAAHFSDFFKHALDRFGKPVEENGNGRHQVTRKETLGERNAREYEELIRNSLAASASNIGADTENPVTEGLPIDIGGH